MQMELKANAISDYGRREDNFLENLITISIFHQPKQT